MPQTLIVGNWKMNTTPAEAVVLAREVRDGLDAPGNVEVVLCPPAISLVGVSQVLEGSPVKVGAQNIHHEDAGAYTGEISPAMLSGVCRYVIVGHSERRQLFGEDDGQVNLKLLAALRHGLRPILCVGETLEERESGQAAPVIERQVRAGLSGVVDISGNGPRWSGGSVKTSNLALPTDCGLSVAYEPIWAIGTGQAATPEIAAEIMGGAIQATLADMFGESADDVSLLYGGSVNPGNVSGFIAQDCIHGALVGGASLQAGQFVEIVRLAAAAKAGA